jgi:hypothetical protein
MSLIDPNMDTEPNQEVEQSTTVDDNAVTETSETVETVEEAIKPEQPTTVDNNAVTETVEIVEITETIKTVATDYNSMTKNELIDLLKEIIEKEVDSIKNEVEAIKLNYYKKLKTETEEQKKLFIENGGDENNFIPQKDESEEHIKTLLNEFKIKKANYTAALEKEKENNLIQKQHIIEQMKMLVDNNTDVSVHINEFRDLQKKWRSIGNVPATANTELWKQYNLLQESFWDLIKINNELREYDFKKNLELKTQLCETAEKLIAEEDVVLAFQKLQKLHDEWHELGPVARDLREQIWSRFKEASTAINKKYQIYFDNIRKIEDDNFETKIALCEKIEALDFSGFNSFKQWDEASKTVMGWQDEWRRIGFAPRKDNQKIFDRYRKACDTFFSAKVEYYKETRAIFNQNLEKKRALCDQANALKNSTDWKETSEKMIELQKEWKTIGTIPKKYSDEIWKEFLSACDYFFEQKTKNFSGQKTAETQNLAKKSELITAIQQLNVTENPAEALVKLRELMAEWNNVGHVPFKEKDRIYKEFRTSVDKQFEALNVDASQRRLDNFKNNLKDMTVRGENKLFREREKLVRTYEHLNSEIATYENNIGFFTSASKKGGGLIKEMERKIEALKEEAKLIEQKINMIEDAIQ